MKLRPVETIQLELEFFFHQMDYQKEIFELAKFYDKHERETILYNWFVTAISVIVARRHEGQVSEKKDSFLREIVLQKARPYFNKRKRKGIKIANASKNLAIRIFEIFESYEPKN